MKGMMRTLMKKGKENPKSHRDLANILKNFMCQLLQKVQLESQNSFNSLGHQLKGLIHRTPQTII